MQPGSALGGALSAGPSERFGVRATSRFPFLRPDRVRDAEGRRPGDPGYDPTTLFLPPTWLHDAKISEGQRQWWAFKAANFDAVLLFKMGKFYELFEMDAHVGVELLGLTYMRGEQPHAGFPEAAYAGMAATLARAGVKVVVIEQTETPEALAARNEKRRQSGQKKVHGVLFWCMCGRGGDGGGTPEGQHADGGVEKDEGLEAMVFRGGGRMLHGAFSGAPHPCACSQTHSSRR